MTPLYHRAKLLVCSWALGGDGPGPDEIDLVNSGLEETMVSAYREIREVHHTRVPKENMRTAAFIIAIKKVALTYEQLGIFP